jgi:hypothetical protein
LLGEGAYLLAEREKPLAQGATVASRRKEEKKREKEALDRAREGREAPVRNLKSLKLRSEVVPDQTSYMAGVMREGKLIPSVLGSTPPMRMLI